MPSAPSFAVTRSLPPPPCHAAQPRHGPRHKQESHTGGRTPGRIPVAILSQKEATKPPGGAQTTGEDRGKTCIGNGGRMGRGWSASQPGHRVVRGCFVQKVIEAVSGSQYVDANCPRPAPRRGDLRNLPRLHLGVMGYGVAFVNLSGTFRSTRWASGFASLAGERRTVPRRAAAVRGRCGLIVS